MSGVRLTIDGRATTVAAGTSVLEAARGLGIHIPTLCFVEEIEPSASCFLCVVQVEGRAGLSPSCALPVAEGMVVTTDSADLRATRRMALELLLSDHAGECAAPCERACPAELDIPGFVLGLAQGDERAAMRVIGCHLALPGALGRICPRLCEQRCRRCGFDEGLSIGALHRFAADRDLAGDDPWLPPRAPRTGKSVAIIGAGPAGLAAAYYLLQDGHGCTLYDAHAEPGGMLRYGIPAYRLPREALAAEIASIERMGARFELGRRWGEDFHLDELRARHDAVFVAIGAQRALGLDCQGAQHAFSGIALLEEVASGERPRLGPRVLVIGGGNTAMDAARTAVRLQATEAGETGSVRVLYRRTRAEMPCLHEEVEDAEAEGVSIECGILPLCIERDAEGELRVLCQRTRPGAPDASGRRRPEPIPGSEHELRATSVIAAVGQAVALELARSEGLAVGRHGLVVDPTTLATALPDVFAGGDAVLGPDLAVRAVAAGRRAAASITQHLRGEAVVGLPTPAQSLFQPMDEDELAAIFRSVEHVARSATQRLAPERRRASFEEVDRGLAEDSLLEEARRCMSCGCSKEDSCSLRRLASGYGADPNRFGGSRRRLAQDHSHPEILYEPGKCIGCEACVRVAAAHEEPLGLALVGRGFEVAMGTPFGEPLSAALLHSAKECVQICPTGALALRSQRACELCASACDLRELAQGAGAV